MSALGRLLDVPLPRGIVPLFDKADGGEMAASEAVAVLDKQLRDLTDHFGRDRRRHKRRGLYLKLSTAALAAFATVLLGWQGATALEVLFKNLALVANALITLFSAYEAFFEPKKLWVRETAVHNELLDVRRELDLELALSELPSERLVSYQQRVNAVLQKSLESWLKDKQA